MPRYEKSLVKQSNVNNNILEIDYEEQKDNNVTKNKELQKIEDEFNAKLQNYEKELAKKHEKALSTQKQALEGKVL